MTQNSPESGVQSFRPDPALMRLKGPLGSKRNTDVRFKPDPSAGKNGSPTYEWLEDGFFLAAQWDIAFIHYQNGGIVIVGYDASSPLCPLHYFDSEGDLHTFQMSLSDGILTITGESERFVGTFSDDGSTITGYWEQSTDGVSWRYLCDEEFTRVT
jgi:hypothetical protein